jgi:DNA polymerase-1
MQTVTNTGRLSCVNPNLQNIPIKSTEGKRIRSAFISSSPDKLLVSADYSQIELRVMAHLSCDLGMIEAFRNNEDIHSATASKIYNTQEVTPEMRSKAKSANFGIIYGISSFGLSENLKISKSEAKELIDGYFKSYPQVKTYMDKMIKLSRINGYVSTLFGRKRYIPEINSHNSMVRSAAERIAINTPVQGTAADIVKICMLNCYQKIKSDFPEAKLILQVHDELVFEIPSEINAKFTESIQHEMENAVKLNVPLLVAINSGKNWLSAH